MSIKPEHMANIASGAKNHEYRRYLLPSAISHIWFYTTAPVSAVQYVARISQGKAPGEVPEDGGVGNAEFNAGQKQSKFGYGIRALWKLGQPITLRQAMVRGFWKGPPQKYTFVSKQMCGEWELEKQTRVIEEDEAVKDHIEEGTANSESVMTKKEGNRRKSLSQCLLVQAQQHKYDRSPLPH